MHTPHTKQPEEEELQRETQHEEQRKTRFKQLFEGCRFFLSREVPREALTFVIRCFGGVVSWDAAGGGCGATYSESDKTVTHQVVDRPIQSHRFLSR